jgi:hypothetical protein
MRISRRLARFIVVVPVLLATLSPAAAQAKGGAIKLKTTKKRTVTGPVKIVAVSTGRPRKVSFRIDGRVKYVSHKAPYTFGGADGRFDPVRLSSGKHRVTVSARFGSGRMARATTTIRVRKRRTTVVSPATGAPITTVVAVTTLPAAPTQTISTTNEKPAWDGSADRGLGAWDYPQSIGNAMTEVVDSPVIAGHKAFKFTVNPGGERSELNQTSNDFGEGQDWWFGDALYVPSTPNKQVGWDNSSHHTFMQLKNDGEGSPPVEFDRRQDGLSVVVNGSNGNAAWSSLLVAESDLYDRAIPIEWHVKFSSDASKGLIEVYVDGKLKASRVIGTLFAGKLSYLKEGQYGVGRGNVIYWHGARRGTSRASVGR